MALTRYMFLNYYSNQQISIDITVYESMAVFEMQAEGSVETQIETHSSGTFTMRIPAGKIWGFGVYDGVSYTNPDPNHLTILTGSGKNPWPPPPPPPAAYASISDFDERYEDFLIALSGTRTSRGA